MLKRILALLAVVAVAVVTAMTTAHAARLATEGAEAVHASHAGHMAADAGTAIPDCGPAQPCDPANADGCAAACSALVCDLAAPVLSSAARLFAARHDPPAAVDSAGRVPPLADRPPISRLA